MKWIIRREKWFNPSLAYFVGKDVDERSTLVVDGKQKTLFLSPLSKIELDEILVETYDRKKFLKFLKAEKTVGMDFENTSAELLNAIKRHVKVEDVGEKIRGIREIKTGDELKKIKEAEKLTKEMFEFAEKQLKDGISEAALKKRILMKTLDIGMETAFEPNVSFGKNTSVPHHVSEEKKLRNEEVVLIDMGLKNELYCADITRCFRLGKKEKIYENLMEIVKELKKEKTTDAVNQKTGKMLREFGYPKLIHNVGHGIGIEVHEKPNFYKDKGDIKKNSVYCLEPAVYYKDFGLRYEEMVYA